MSGVGMFVLPTVEEQVKSQVEQYLLHHALDYFGDRRLVPVQVVVDMCIHLTKHLTIRLEVCEKLAYEQIILGMKTQVVEPLNIKEKE